MSGETERALRVLTCEHCSANVPVNAEGKHILHSYNAHGSYETLEDCYSKHAELLPLLNAAVEQATMQEHANHTQFASDMYSTLIDPCATGSMKESDIWAACLKAARDNRQALYDAQNMVAGAYAAAAKLCELHAADAEYMDEGVERMVKAAHHFDAKTILALTPADARQASQCHVCGDKTDLACSDCRINFATVVYVCKKSVCRDEHERKCCPDKSAAIASAEARVRLEAVDICNAVTKRFPHCTIELREAARLIAAARTPASTKGDTCTSAE